MLRLGIDPRAAAVASLLCTLSVLQPATARGQELAEATTAASAVVANSSQALDPEAATEALLATLDEETRDRSERYTNSGHWLDIIGLLYGLAVAWFLLGSGLSARMRDFAERRSRRKPIQTALYAVQYLLVTTVLLLPLTVYGGYIREHRYGFSTRDLGGYVSDRLIGLGIGLATFSLLLVVLYWVIRRAPRTWWIWGTGVGIGFVVIITFIAPVYLAPLFNQYEPLNEGPLKERVLAMARANGVPADEVYQYDASKRTTKMSANVSGLFGTMRISMNDNLLERGTDAEIEAVMGHEIGHYAMHGASEYFIFFAVFLAFGFAFVNWGFDRARARWGSRWDVRGIGDVAGLPLLGLLLSVYSAVLSPVTVGFIRTNEKEADLYGLNAARQPDGFAEVILKLGEYRKVDPGPLEEWLFYDHPSARNRILMAMRWKAEQLSEETSAMHSVSEAADDEAQPEVWAVGESNPCTGLTVGWNPPLEALQEVVGSHWKPAEGPSPGKGVFLLFSVSCEESTIDGQETGPFTLAATIVRTEAPPEPRGGRGANSWAALPDNFGRAGEPVFELFRRHGFVASEAQVSLSVQESGDGEEARFIIQTAEGRVEGAATFGPEASSFGLTTAIVGTDPELFSLFRGPESGMRQSDGSATVESSGITWVSRLGLAEEPPIVALDREFTWEFSFSSEPYYF
jgi:STE24 endopeptidase